jgi:hypothetical protein
MRAAVQADPRAGAEEILNALPAFGELYLTIKSGHNISERQEIPSNAKLAEIRQQLRSLAEAQTASSH